MVLLLMKPQNVQNLFFFFWKKHGFLEKRFGFFQNRQKWQTFSRIRLKWYQWLRNLKTFKIGVFFEKNGFFFEKEPWNVSKPLNVMKKCSRKRLKWCYCLKNLKTFTICFFFRKKDGFSENIFGIFQNQ